MKIKTEDGQEIEAFTPEEVNAQKEAAAAEAKKEAEEKAKKLEDELAGYKDKDLNFGRMKETFEQKTKDLESKLQAVQDSTKSNMEAEVFEVLSNGDKDLKAKLEAEYKNFRGEPTTKEEITIQARKALAIIKPPVTPGAFDNFHNVGGGRAPGGNSQEKVEFSDTLKKAASNFGITEDDIKKYGK